MVDHPQALEVMAETPRANLVKGLLSRVAERSVPQVVAQGDGFGQILVQRQGFGHSPGNLGHLQGVGEAGAVMISPGDQKHLSLVLEAAERFRMENPVPVVLKSRADTAFRLGDRSPAGLGTELSVGGKDLLFSFFQHSSNGHPSSPDSPLRQKREGFTKPMTLG
jgi:hypothetical protein